MLNVVRRSTELEAMFEIKSSLGVNNQLNICVLFRLRVLGKEAEHTSVTNQW